MSCINKNVKEFQLPKIVHCLNHINTVAYKELTVYTGNTTICYCNLLYKESMVFLIHVVHKAWFV